MCGIVGYVDLNRAGRVEERILDEMANALIHGGPDSRGYFVEPNGGLGTRRLRIIDLETGDQIPVVPWQFRERYRSLVAAHIDALQQIARERRVDYTLLETTTPLDQALFAYLSHRQYTLRVRA